MWSQRTFTLRARPRGAHLVTREVIEALPEIRDLRGRTTCPPTSRRF